MFKLTLSAKPFALAAASFLLPISCGQASYEILKPKAHNNSDQPQQVAPPATNLIAPTARVEVILNTQSVTTVHVGEATTVRPSTDTRSPGFIGKSSCVNVGIVTAAYNIGGLAQPSVSRKGCESLGTPYTFDKVGDYLITMIVTDQNNLTATASMTLTVIDVTNGQDGGFTITANPLLTPKDTPVVFNGYCDMQLPHSISWNYGDGSAVDKGIETKHAFSKVGPVVVNASCTSDDGTFTKKASVTVVVTETAIAMPPDTGVDKPVAPTPILPPVVVNPNQRPNQSTVVQGPNQSHW